MNEINIFTLQENGLLWPAVTFDYLSRCSQQITTILFDFWYWFIKEKKPRDNFENHRANGENRFYKTEFFVELKLNAFIC